MRMHTLMNASDYLGIPLTSTRGSACDANCYLESRNVNKWQLCIYFLRKYGSSFIYCIKLALSQVNQKLSCYFTSI